MDFKSSFESLTGFPPFRWQARLFNDYFSKGEIPSALDLPTGLGKTSVMAVWLIARAAGAKLPRRLVYVVDRRAVVDQATAEAEKLRNALDGEATALKAGLGLADRSLPISTLRGQFVDNREWLADPAAPAIIIGTVDMIGSRILFEGYGVSRKMRPYHAGLLGADALVVLDEAHLVPPFEKLLESIEKGVSANYADNRQGAFGPKNADDRKFIPSFGLLSLSATGREREGEPFRLIDEDFNDEIVKKRLNAKKALSIKALEDKETLESALTTTAWSLAGNGVKPVRCLIYCNKRETAQKVFDELEKRAAPEKKGEDATARIELFTGARRFFERENTALKLNELGFIAGTSNKSGKPAFLVATSAAEVGVDLDADHMVCDLAAWERMVQRLGRVNRRGEGDAKVIVIDPGKPNPKNKDGKPKKPEELTDSEKRAVLAYNSLEAIKKLRDTESDNAHDASPAGLLDLKQRAATDKDIRSAIEAATTPAPLRPALTRALIDAWSMTSLEKHTGRPEVAPWLRGWVDEDGPQTAVIWRTHLPVRTEGGDATDKEVQEFFEAAPPHVSEKLETETYTIADWLMKRAAELLNTKQTNSETAEDPDEVSLEESPETGTDDVSTGSAARRLNPEDIVAFTLSSAREVMKAYRLKVFKGDKKDKDALKKELHKELAGTTLIVDAHFGGLSSGLLDDKAAAAPRTVDDDAGEWLPAPPRKGDGKPEPLVKFRVRIGKRQHSETPDDEGEDTRNDAQWHKPFRFPIELDGDGNATRSLIVEKWRDASTREEERSISQPQSLVDHQSWAEKRAIAIAKGVRLEGDHAKALAIAARLHDEGKRAKRWQRAFNAHRSDETLERPLAKTKGPINFNLLGGYRHEFGSLPYAQDDAALKSLPEDLQDLVLHLIASHHGGARPVIGTRGCEDAPPSALEQRACDVALRFARLQKQWGPWGLAWWEALLRAADQQASRENDERGRRATNDQTADEAERA